MPGIINRYEIYYLMTVRDVLLVESWEGVGTKTLDTLAKASFVPFENGLEVEVIVAEDDFWTIFGYQAS